MSKVCVIIIWCHKFSGKLFLASNILMQQSCSCESPLMCICPEGKKTCYVLGDMNLLHVEGEGASELWHKMVPEAAGTHRMKPPEVAT